MISESFQRIPYETGSTGSRVEMHSGLSRHYPLLHGNLVSTSDDRELGLVMAHPASNFLTHFLLAPLAEAGLPVMGVNTRYTGNEAALLMENAASDLGSAVDWMREELGFRKVALLGFSGGGPLASFYQAQAARAGKHGADALLLVGAHPGRARVLSTWIDPSVVDEDDPFSVDPQWNLYEPGRTAPYDREWVAGYREQQLARIDRIDRWALAELARVEERGATDRAFVVHRTVADPRFLDLTLDPSDRQVGSMYGDPAVANTAAGGLARFTTLRSWLSTWSLTHTRADALKDLPDVRIPTLVMPLLADQAAFAGDSRAMYEAAAGPAELIEVADYNHYLVGQPGAAADIAGRISCWLDKEVR
ncbi:alpha/beta hydrolase [Amycolatopsis acidicola]|uniref:Alpha/beta hydrolase n=1 Tax=Amycolatopsis acidicola TaxID=2596893 RepID=A0A5N0UUU0_9PSEU|nr:alpha/beta hydrolase [Amycolatopsis acidicola]KAA9152322.1 alpha/beta hydrolase [Amycolatopsis acidicola]